MHINIEKVLPMSAWYMLLSAFSFALMAMCVKIANTNYQIPVLEIVAARALVSIVISYVDIKYKKISPWGHNIPWLIARGTVGALALICVYYAISTLPLAEATILQYLHPAFTAVLALLFLKEHIQRSTMLCIILGLLGLFIMIQPNLIAENIHYSWMSIMAGLLGALGSAIAYVIVKKLTTTDDSSVIIFYFPMIALPISLLLLGDDFVLPGLAATGILLLVGVFTQIGQIGLTKALHSAEASKATAYAYVQVIFSILIGWIFFSEIPVFTTIIGGILILVGALINVLWKR